MKLKESQISRLKYTDGLGKRYVQAFINNIAFPKSLEWKQFFLKGDAYD